ncbi:hypothetical protein LSH36_28g01043 [Paralvinella palmiformis]|uniref:Mediator of RNA polymerase II transcription subunit 8 n=1 Tax=Paralvinella palmiformis TaxID=53620 RepID=A0AAD9K9S7_9ANNE|nr:hypothetical protein LSH36_28g01043 [Paralvinella palmiformis]
MAFRKHQREEKQIDATVEALIQRVTDVKNSISSFIAKLESEYETISWPSVLDNFALLSGQISSLNRLLKNEKTSVLRNHVLIPLVLAVDRDTELEKLTERRVLFFNHEVVPNYLRTKCEPAAEEKLHTYLTRANSIGPDPLQKQINTMNKVSASMCEMIKSHRESTENESNQKSQLQQTSSPTDTATLIAAVTAGKNLRSLRRPESAGPPTGSMQPQQSQMGQGMADQRQTHNPPGYYHPGYNYRGAPNIQMNKAPSNIKTTIKSGTTYHPYNR